MTYNILDILEVDFPPDSKEWLIQYINNLNQKNIEFYDVENISSLIKLVEKDQIPTQFKMNDQWKLFFSDYVNEIFLNSHKYNLFDFYSVVEVIENIGLEKEFPKELIKVILNAQNSDGTWSYSLDNSSDEQSTFLAIYILDYFDQEIPNKENILNTIEKQKAYNGGYSRKTEEQFALFETFVISHLGNYMGFTLNNEDETQNLIKEKVNYVDWDMLSNKEFLLYFLNALQYNVIEIDKLESVLVNRINNIISAPKDNNPSDLFWLLTILLEVNQDSTKKIKNLKIELDNDEDIYINVYNLGIKMLMNTFKKEDFNYLNKVLEENPQLSKDIHFVWILSKMKYSDYYSEYKNTEMYQNVLTNFNLTINQIALENRPLNLQEAHLITEILIGQK